jgi:hypothetical protein
MKQRKIVKDFEAAKRIIDAIDKMVKRGRCVKRSDLVRAGVSLPPSMKSVTGAIVDSEQHGPSFLANMMGGFYAPVVESANTWTRGVRKEGT